MAILSPQFLRLGQRWVRPTGVAIFFIAALAIWAGWSGFRAWRDEPLPDNAISAHEIRVNTGQLTKLTNALDQYHHPTAAVNPGNVSFQAQTPSP